MSTNAKPTSRDSSHWYFTDGKPCYELPKKDGSGMKVPTLADARKLNLLPSVTTILKVLHKEALVNWLVEQACLAVLTSPRLPDEDLDSFVARILHTERVQDQESIMARDRGTQIHAALEGMFLGQVPDAYLLPWVEPAFRDIVSRGQCTHLERCVVGVGYAGKLDLQMDCDRVIWLWDWKTTKKLPQRGAWPEHRLQLAAYAEAVRKETDRPIRTGNVYVSTVEQGAYVVAEHPEDWTDTYQFGFLPLVQHWQWSTNYSPVLNLGTRECK